MIECGHLNIYIISKTIQCRPFNALRAPKERHPQRYSTLGGATCEFTFTREAGEPFTVGVSDGTPLLFVRETPDAELQFYHVGEDVTRKFCSEVEALLHPELD